MNERWEAFDRIWAKGKTNKMVQRLMSKCQLRGLEPTEENCRDYWMGYIRYYVDGWTGQGYHVNPRKNKILRRNETYQNDTNWFPFVQNVEDILARMDKMSQRFDDLENKIGETQGMIKNLRKILIKLEVIDDRFIF